jgi:rhomboid protease GluP
MCRNCRAFIPDSERYCTECNAPMGESYARRAAFGSALGGLVPQTHFTTLIILLLNGGLFAATLLMSMKQSEGGGLWGMNNYVLYYFGAKESASIFAGQWWRLVTAGFLHGGLLHFLMNSWVLYDLGAQAEEAYGTARFLVFYLVSSVTGFLASALWTRALSIGASAALFGLIGAMIAFGYRYRHTAAGSFAKAVYTRWVIYGLLFTLLIPHIDMAAHLGGLAAGFALGYVAGVPRLGVSEWYWKLGAALALLIVALSFGMVWLTFPSAAQVG